MPAYTQSQCAHSLPAHTRAHAHKHTSQYLLVHNVRGEAEIRIDRLGIVVGVRVRALVLGFCA